MRRKELPKKDPSVQLQIHSRFSAAKNGRFDVAKLHFQQTAERFSTRPHVLSATQRKGTVRRNTCLCTATNEIITFERSISTFFGWDRYRELKREARRMCRHKKGKCSDTWVWNLEKLAGGGNPRKFSENILWQGRSKLLNDPEGWVSDWRPECTEFMERTLARFPIDDNRTYISLWWSINSSCMLEKRQSNGWFAAKLYKSGGGACISFVPQYGRMKAWNPYVLCSNQKKVGYTVCANNSGKSLINIAYKTLSSVLWERREVRKFSVGKLSTQLER